MVYACHISSSIINPPLMRKIRTEYCIQGHWTYRMKLLIRIILNAISECQHMCTWMENITNEEKIESQKKRGREVNIPKEIFWRHWDKAGLKFSNITRPITDLPHSQCQVYENNCSHAGPDKRIRHLVVEFHSKEVIKNTEKTSNM